MVPGVRISIYTSGCTHKCPGCHNPEGWDFNKGEEYSEATEGQILTEIGRPYIRGLSILGGEPFDSPDPEALLNLVRKIKTRFYDKDIWVWTGYEWDQIKSSPLTKYIDVVVCGRFEINKRDISDNNRWRGSTNQRVIDAQKSLTENKLILLAGIPNNEI